jgi:hypothetical protein
MDLFAGQRWDLDHRLRAVVEVDLTTDRQRTYRGQTVQTPISVTWYNLLFGARTTASAGK